MRSIRDKILQTNINLLDKISEWKASGYKIVFTNGCFDIIHLGHVLYLENAASLGDKLVVAINSDDSVKKLKGPHRPINDIINRTHVLEALESVDAVIVFEESTPLNIINDILPDILVKGGDWDPSQIVGSEAVLKNGGKVQSLQFVDGYSTSKIEARIKQV